MFIKPTLFRAISVPFTTLVVLAAAASLAGCSAETDDGSPSTDAVIGTTQSESAEESFGAAFSAGESTTRADVGAIAPRPSPKSDAVDVACKKTLDPSAPCE